MEKLYYETRPYALLAFAIYAMKFSPSSSIVLSSVSAAALLTCSSLILFWRFSARRNTFGGTIQTIRVRR